MIPAHTALAQTAAAPHARLGFVYFPHGAVRQFWTPKNTGRDFEFSHMLKPLEPLRDYVTVVSRPAQQGRGEQRRSAWHHRAVVAVRAWVAPGRNANGEAGITVDQIAVKHIGPGHAAALARAVHRARWLQLAVAIARPTSSWRWRTIRARCSTRCSARATTRKSAQQIVQHHGQPAGLRARCHGVAEQGTGRQRSRHRQRLPGIRARDRAARAEAQGQPGATPSTCPMRRWARRMISPNCSTCSSS